MLDVVSLLYRYRFSLVDRGDFGLLSDENVIGPCMTMESEAPIIPAATAR